MKIILYFVTLITLHVSCGFQDGIVLQDAEIVKLNKEYISIFISYLKQVLDNIVQSISRQWFRKILEIAGNIADVLNAPPDAVPILDQNRWWGDGDLLEDISIRPFNVNFDDEMISDLRQRILSRRNLTLSLQGSVHTYGINTRLVNQLLDCWADQECYDFKDRERKLNQFPQFLTNIQGLDIHFIHIKPSTQKRVVPILLLHGWPYSAFEFRHLIGYLMQDGSQEFSFEIIVPDIPGYAYSEGTNKMGLAPYEVGVIFKNLMTRLGHEEFYIHCGDVGQWVGDAMAVMYPDRVLGLHTNFPYSARPETLVKYILGQLYPQALVTRKYEDRMYPLTSKLRFILLNFGYFVMQSSRPDMLKALEDSPTGLTAYFIQNEVFTSNPQNLLRADGGLLEYHLTDLIDPLTVYWDSHSIITSVRLYAEFTAWYQNPLSLRILMTPTKVPYAAIKFRHELIYQPDELLRDKYPNLVQSTTLDFGGHSAATENPHVLAESIWAAVEKFMEFRRNSGVVQGIRVEGLV